MTFYACSLLKSTPTVSYIDGPLLEINSYNLVRILHQIGSIRHSGNIFTLPHVPVKPRAMQGGFFKTLETFLRQSSEAVV